MSIVDILIQDMNKSASIPANNDGMAAFIVFFLKTRHMKINHHENKM